MATKCECKVHDCKTTIFYTQKDINGEILCDNCELKCERKAERLESTKD
jgi:hypothetical protein